MKKNQQPAHQTYYEQLGKVYYPALYDYFNNKDNSDDCFNVVINLFTKFPLDYLRNFEKNQYDYDSNKPDKFYVEGQMNDIFNKANKIPLSSLKRIYAVIVANKQNQHFDSANYVYSMSSLNTSLSDIFKTKPDFSLIKEIITLRQHLGIKDDLVSWFRGLILSHTEKFTMVEQAPNALKIIELFFEHGLFISDNVGKNANYNYVYDRENYLSNNNLLDVALSGEVQYPEAIEIKKQIIALLLEKGVSPNKMNNYKNLTDQTKMKILVGEIIKNNPDFLPKSPYILLAFCIALPSHLNHLVETKVDKMKDFLLGLERKLPKYNKMFEDDVVMHRLWNHHEHTIITFIEKVKLKNMLHKGEVKKLKKQRKELREGNKEKEDLGLEPVQVGSFRDQLQKALNPPKRKKIL